MVGAELQAWWRRKASPCARQFDQFNAPTPPNAVAFERPLLRCLDVRFLRFRDIGVHKTAGI